MQAVTLAAVATLSSPAAVDAVVDRRAGRLARPARCSSSRLGSTPWSRSSRSGWCWPSSTRATWRPGVRPPTATEWAVINLAVGVASGVLFHLFLGPRGHLDEGRLFVALAGAIVVASGASYYLNLSPIFTNLVLGFILANSGSAHRDVTRLLLSTERPGLSRAAALRRRGLEPGLGGPAVHRPAVRGDPGGGPVPGRSDRRRARGARRSCGRPGLGRGLLALGGIGVALALNYGQVYPDLHPPTGPDRDAAVGAAVRDRGQPGGVRVHAQSGQPGAGARRDAAGAGSGGRAAMIRRLVVLVLLVGGAVLLEPLRVPTEGVIAPRSLFLFGILLLTADTFGAMAHDLGFPRLVGYLVAGLALGPSVAGRRAAGGAPGPLA